MLQKIKSFIYFCRVKDTVVIKRQLIAASLLIVFSVITAAKLFHSHESGVAFVNSGGQLVKNADCSICDYHFTKDADLVDVFFEVQKFTPLIIFSFIYRSRTTSSIGLNFSDRGPPAFS